MSVCETHSTVPHTPGDIGWLLLLAREFCFITQVGGLMYLALAAPGSSFCFSQNVQVPASTERYSTSVMLGNQVPAHIKVLRPQWNTE